MTRSTADALRQPFLKLNIPLSRISLVRNLPTFNIQRLFGLALSLKVGFAGLGYVLGMPFWLGLVAPMAVMLAYIVVGYHARDNEVSEDKFADSCYYLGFIFTIVSIIFCLLDIPKMTAGAGLRDIATRFGAAMVSTVLGMGVRVYLVSFRKDASDAMQDAETALLDSTRLFTAQLQENLKTMQSFEQQVVAAGQASVAGVQTQVEALARNFSETLSKFYAELNEENRAAFREMVDEVKGASAKLAASVDGYSQGMQTHLGNIEGKVTQFADAVSARLDKTTFPDDYFATRLKAPLDQLVLETQGVGGSVRAVNDEVKTSAVALRSTLASMNSKMKAGTAVMETVLQMAEQHRALLDTSEKQASTYERFIERMGQIEEALDEVVRTAGATNQASAEVLTRLAGVAADGTALREAIRTSMAGLASGNVALSEVIRSSITQVASKLDGQAQVTAGLLLKVDQHAERFGQGSTGIVLAIEGHSERMAAVNGRFDTVASASQGLTRQLEAVVASNMQLIDGSHKRLAGFERAEAQSEKIVASLSAGGAALREAIRTSMAGLASGNVALSSSITQVASKLDGQAQVTAGLLVKVDQHAERFGQGSAGIVQALQVHAKRMDTVNGRFDAVASASQGLTRQLEAVVVSNLQLLDGSRKRLEGFELAAAHSEKIVSSLAEIHPLLNRHVEALRPTSALTADREDIFGLAQSQAHSLSDVPSTAESVTGGDGAAPGSPSTAIAEGRLRTPAAPQRPSFDA